ncbi:MAG: DUF2784 domain-containing protein [PVC group bacterium]
MLYIIFAHIVILLHLAFIIFVPLGGFLVLRRRYWAWIHVPVFAWGAAISFGGWICPLTPLENWLRHKGGELGYSGGFIEHYILPVIYPGNLTRGIQIAIGIGVLAINLIIYSIVISRALRKKHPRS